MADVVESPDLLRKALEYLEGSDPLMTSGGHKNQALCDEIRARLSQAGSGGMVREALEAAYDFLGGVDGASEVRDKLLSALAPSPSAGEPVGWKLVPIEPTEAMLDAYWSQTGESREMRSRTHAYMRRYWSAMLTAAPTTEQEHAG